MALDFHRPPGPNHTAASMSRLLPQGELALTNPSK